MVRLFILSLSLIVAACTSVVIPPGTDVVEWRLTNNLCNAALELRDEGYKFPYGNCSNWLGFSIWDEGTCIIVTPRPESINDLEIYETILHELKHCDDGVFHIF